MILTGLARVLLLAYFQPVEHLQRVLRYLSAASIAESLQRVQSCHEPCIHRLNIRTNYRFATYAAAQDLFFLAANSKATATTEPLYA